MSCIDDIESLIHKINNNSTFRIKHEKEAFALISHAIDSDNEALLDIVRYQTMNWYEENECLKEAWGNLIDSAQMSINIQLDYYQGGSRYK